MDIDKIFHKFLKTLSAIGSMVITLIKTENVFFPSQNRGKSKINAKIFPGTCFDLRTDL